MGGAKEIVERTGLKFEADGLPRIAGRILGYLLLAPEPKSLDALAGELLVSKTSASTNARLLERAGVVERASRPGDRRDYYRITEDLHARLLDVRLRQLQDTRDLLADALEVVSGDDPVVEARLRTWVAFHTHMVEAVSEASREWRERYANEDAPGRGAAGGGKA